jgi:hypothetical protein
MTVTGIETAQLRFRCDARGWTLNNAPDRPMAGRLPMARARPRTQGRHCKAMSS